MTELRIELIAVGDELLMGMTLDTNSHFIANELATAGCRLQRLMWVADNQDAIRLALKESFKRSDIVIVTGGLGPTHDDMTRPAIASLFADRLETRQDLLEAILERFRVRGLKSAPGWEVMAEFPTGAVPITNANGAAPGIHYKVRGKELFAVPGVPSEMRGMMTNYITPEIRLRSKGKYGYRVIKTLGIGESHLAQLIGDPAGLLPASLAFLPSIDSGVTLRLSLHAETDSELKRELARAGTIVVEKVAPYIYAQEDKSLEAVIVDLLREKSLRLALAESCTGGMIAARIINVPGSSDVLDRGLVTYSNRSKEELADVPPGLIERFGAVSEEVAGAMAEGVRRSASVEVGLAVTGIAGPGGGSETKPVGLTYIGIADANHVIVSKHLFAGNRDENRRRSTLAALSLLYNRLRK